MVKRKDPYPSEGDLVICTIKKVSGHGAFASLDEYPGTEGFIHISEVASIWVKNIRDYVREGQKSVAKVLSVDPERGHIDLSVRRVGDNQRTNKTQEWKRELKAEKLLEMAGEEIGKNLDQAYEEVGFTLEERYGGVYNGLEEVLLEGGKVLQDVPEDWVEPLTRLVKENIVLPTVDIEGFIELRTTDGEGVKIIKESLVKALETPLDKEIKMDIKYMSPPSYRIHVNAPDYKSAEDAMKKASETAIKYMLEHGGEGSYRRDGKGN